MKHLFLVNPAAGKYDRTYECAEQIHAVCKARGLDYEIRVSKKPGDLTRYAAEACAAGTELRLYACGGDGTLNEVVNGAAGHPTAAITHFPRGSGNDFIKIFSDPARFRDLAALLECEETSFDLIRCNDTYAINICSMGLDARIGTEMARYKRLPGVSGSGAYILSTAVNFVKGIHEPYTVEVDGEVIEGRRTMICVCSGRCYGGGFRPVPEAEPDDGLLDVLLVRPVTRLQVAQVIGPYKQGKFRDYPHLFRYFRAKEITVRCGETRVVNLDGEARYAETAHFSVVPQGIRFFYPRGLSYHAAVPAHAE